MCGGGGLGGLAGALVGGAVGFMTGGSAGVLAGATGGLGIGGMLGSMLDPTPAATYNFPEIKAPGTNNMGTGETGALVELGSDSDKAERLSSTGTGRQSGGSSVAGLGSGGLMI